MSRELDGNDIIHITPVGPTGALSQVEVPVSLDELVAFLRTRLLPDAAPEEAPQ